MKTDNVYIVKLINGEELIATVSQLKSKDSSINAIVYKVEFPYIIAKDRVDYNKIIMMTYMPYAEYDYLIIDGSHVVIIVSADPAISKKYQELKNKNVIVTDKLLIN